MTSETAKRINVTFPTSLLEELGRFVPARERNRFIVEATEKEYLLKK
jgi:metal-responsive CopG/Arc/MetJ family transcriptional regulator